MALVRGRAAALTSWALCLLAEARRLLADAGAEAAALDAQASGERLSNRLLETQAGLTLGRLAAARSDWTDAQQLALAHLDACVEGGHATYVPGCLDALAEVAAGLGADEDAVRLFAAAERARPRLACAGAAGDAALGGYEAKLHEGSGKKNTRLRARRAPAAIEDALEWAPPGARAARRPPGGWASLTPTESGWSSSSPRASPTRKSPSGCSSQGGRKSIPTSATSSPSSSTAARASARRPPDGADNPPDLPGVSPASTSKSPLSRNRHLADVLRPIRRRSSVSSEPMLKG